LHEFNKGLVRLQKNGVVEEIVNRHMSVKNY